MPESRAPRRWPLFLIASPAAVAIWSGWVGLGELAGFGVVHPLPGIWDGLRLNTAITLPVGVEAYAAYALGAWMAPGTPGRAREFARWSALGSLALGILGQVSYHLLAASHAARAPALVIVGVSCMPVAVLGLGAALTHLLRVSEAAGEDQRAVPAAVPEAYPGVPELFRRAEREFAAALVAGRVPGVRPIKEAMGCGQPKAKQVQLHLAAVARTRSNGHGGAP